MEQQLGFAFMIPHMVDNMRPTIVQLSCMETGVDKRCQPGAQVATSTRNLSCLVVTDDTAIIGNLVMVSRILMARTHRIITTTELIIIEYKEPHSIAL